MSAPAAQQSSRRISSRKGSRSSRWCSERPKNASQALERHDWPGNVRELEKAISRAVVFADGGRICTEDLGIPMPGGAREDTRTPVLARAADSGTLSRRQLEALRIATERGALRRRDLMTRWGISRETARRELARLVGRGLLQKIGRGRGARYVP